VDHLGVLGTKIERNAWMFRNTATLAINQKGAITRNSAPLLAIRTRLQDDLSDFPFLDHPRSENL
jgi:hypothetical protein